MLRKMAHTSEHAAPRRLFAMLCLLIYLCCPRITPAAHAEMAQPAPRPNLIQAENALPGTTAWRLVTPARSHEIEGFASRTSVNRGEPITLYVNTPAPSYQIDVYRIGWYDGTGARFMLSVPSLRGYVQPDPLITRDRVVECFWKPSYTLHVPVTWVSGYYLAKLTAETGQQSYIIFIVRDDTSTSTFLVQASVTTYEAYNHWGGYSLYGGEGENQYNVLSRGSAVSFDRPYDDGYGAGNFLSWEAKFVRWSEAGGYDLTYATDIDLQEQPGMLLRHHAFISVGHDEYWSATMRARAEYARDRGVNLAFLGADDVFWNVRMHASAYGPDRVIVCYKSGTQDPLLHVVGNQFITNEWRYQPMERPEQSLIGTMFSGQVSRSFAMVLTHTHDPLFRDTGFHEGTVVPGIVGYEYDRAWPLPSRPSTLVVLSHAHIVNRYSRADDSNMTYYTARSGAFVFSAGTIEFSWALDPFDEQGVASSGMQQFTANVLARLAVDRRRFAGESGMAGFAPPAFPPEFPPVTAPARNVTAPLRTVDGTAGATLKGDLLRVRSIEDGRIWTVHLGRATVCREILDLCSVHDDLGGLTVGVLGVASGPYQLQAKSISVRPLSLLGIVDRFSAGMLAFHTRTYQRFTASLDPNAYVGPSYRNASEALKPGVLISILGFLRHHTIIIQSLFPKPSQLSGRLIGAPGGKRALVDDQGTHHLLVITPSTHFMQHNAQTDGGHAVLGGTAIVDGVVDVDGTILAQTITLGPIVVRGTFMRSLGASFGFLIYAGSHYYQIYLAPDTLLYAALTPVSVGHLPLPGTPLVVSGYFSPPHVLLAATVRW